MSCFEPSAKYLVRIVKVLKAERQIAVSTLATAARMNQQRCNAHLSWLEERGYVKIVPDGKRRLVIVTEQGLESIKRLVSFFNITSIGLGSAVLYGIFSIYATF